MPRPGRVLVRPDHRRVRRDRPRLPLRRITADPQRVHDLLPRTVTWPAAMPAIHRLPVPGPLPNVPPPVNPPPSSPRPAPPAPATGTPPGPGGTLRRSPPGGHCTGAPAADDPAAKAPAAPTPHHRSEERRVGQ